MKEGEKEGEVRINAEIPPNILKDVLDDSRKRKAEDAIDYRSYKARVSAKGQYCDAAGAAYLGILMALGTLRGVGSRSTVLGIYTKLTATNGERPYRLRMNSRWISSSN